MKKSIIILLISLVSGISAFAKNEETVNKKVLSSFNKEFATATNTNWEVNRNYTKVTFVLNEQVLFGYYNAEGEKLAVIRNLRITQLPISLATKVKKSYGNYWISDLFEVSTATETTYYISVENAEQKITLKSDGTLGWTVFQKNDKE